MASNSEEAEVVSKPRVSIRSLSGRTCHFDVTESTTVGQLKHIIAGDMEVPVERQRLLFQGKMLHDGQILKEVGCFNKVIHLVKRAEPPPTSASPAPPPADTAATTASGTSTTSGVIFGGFPFISPQVLNNVWTMGQPPSSSAPTGSAPPAGANAPPPLPNPRANRSAPGIMWDTRHLLQICEGLLDRFDRGETINPQEQTQLSDPGPGPSVSVASSLLGDLYLQIVGVYSRLSPLLREQARFLQEDRALGEEERAAQERISNCIRAVLGRLHVCEVHLVSLSVPLSQAPPRTVQMANRGRRRVVIQTPHMAHVQVNINQPNATQAPPPVPAPATAATSDATVPPPPNAPPNPLLAPSPAELSNMFVQAISSIFPGVQASADGSQTNASAVPHTITGEAVFIQNGVVNNIPFGTGAGPLPPLFPSGIPQDQTVTQLARLMYPGFVEESGEDICSRLILLICNLVTVAQMREIRQGRVERLQEIYPRIKEFVVTELVPEGSASGEGDREGAGRRLAESTVEHLEGLLEALPAQEGLNVKETFINFFQDHFKKAITLILHPRNEDMEASNTENRFGKVIWGWSHTLLCELFQLTDVLARAGSTDIHSVLELAVRNLIIANVPINLGQALLRENRENINSIIRSSPLTEQQIKDKFFIYSHPEPPPLPEPAAPPGWVPQEWKHCIEEDHIEIQNSRQTSFSNSYMAFSGLTDGKNQNATCTGEDMLCDTLKMSIGSSQAHMNTSVDEVIHDVRQNSTLKKRYNEFIDSNLNKRVRSDPNYTPERFPNSAVRFKPDES